MFPPRISTTTTDDAYYSFKIKELVDNASSVTGWKGPYISDSKSGDSLKYNSSGNFHIGVVQLDDAAALGGGNSWQGAKCLANKICSYWVLINNFSTDDVIKQVDTIVDSGDGSLAGNVRWNSYVVSDVTYYAIYKKIMPAKNPH